MDQDKYRQLCEGLQGRWRIYHIISDSNETFKLDLKNILCGAKAWNLIDDTE